MTQPRLTSGWTLAVGLATLAAGCHATPPPSPEDRDRATVAEARSAAETMLRQQTSRAWVAWVAGETAAQSPDGTDSRWVYAPATLDAVRRVIREEKEPDTRRALHFLHAFLVGENVKAEVAEIDVQIAELERQTVELDGLEIRYRETTRVLANEADPMRRRRVSEAVLPVLDQLNPLLTERQARVRAAARRLGYRDPARVGSEIRQYDVRGAGELAEAVLRSSDAVYLAALRDLVPAAVDVPFDRLRPADLPRLRHAPRFAEQFPADGALPALRRTLEHLGIDGERLPVFIDARERRGKNPRAACFPVVVPLDIRLSIQPTGGALDYRLLLHEMGHALQFAHTRTNVFELQQLGDASVAEAMAFLVEGIVDEPAWLEDVLGVGEPTVTEMTRMAAFERLLMVRRYAARLLFELHWRGSGNKRGRALYREQMSRAYGFPLESVDAQRYLVDQDPFYYAADYVRGWVLAAQLRDHLVAKFGERWWTKPEATALLRSLWADGQRWVAEEIAHRLDLGPLRPEPLVRQAARALLRQPSMP